MNIFIDTKYNLSPKIINLIIGLNNYDMDTNIVQLDYNDNTDIIKFIKDTNSNNGNYNNIINKITEFTDKQIVNSLFNKLCVLYLNGGIVINNNVVVNNILNVIDIYDQYDICSIKSCIKNEIFSGLLCCKKGEEKLLNIINLYLKDFEKLNINDLLMKLLDENKEKYMILQEKMIEDESNIYFKEEIIAKHYFTTTHILEKYYFRHNVPKDLSKIKVGITIYMPSCIKDFYTNGIKQNSLYLYELLKNIGYDVKLIIENEKYINVLEEIDFYNFEYVTLKNIFLYEFNLIFTMGFSIPKELFKMLQNIGVKQVYYMCGNNYLIDTERVLYNQHKNRTISYNEAFDEIWIIPQMYHQNKYYCETLYKSKSIQIPFIWSPMSIKFVKKICNLSNEEELEYKKKDSKIAICEPNISVMKWALPCILLAENTYRTYKNINHIYITNMSKSTVPEKNEINQFNVKEFNNMLRGLELFKDKKMSIEDRHITLGFLKQHCDIIISHQWENPLNYLYLEVAWMGWPILHNAYLCKDVGYYYEGFNYYEGSEILNNILINHDTNAKKYLDTNRKIIDQYIPTNKALQIKYKNLIENLFIHP